MSIETFDTNTAKGAQFETYRTIQRQLPRTLSLEELTDLLSMLLLTYLPKEGKYLMPHIFDIIYDNMLVNFKNRGEEE